MNANTLDYSTDLAGQTAVITGASAGLGWRFAQVLAACDAKVAVVARRKDRLETLVREIEMAGGAAAAFVLDVARPETFPAMIDEIEDTLGTVSILVNNAGMPDAQYATKMSLDLVSQVIDVNLKGPFMLSCEVAKRLIEAGRPGRIVNISSIGAYAYSGQGAALYSTTKAAIIRATEALAIEWARFNINVNAIAPGTFRSEMTDGMFERMGGSFLERFPRKRIGEPSQLDSTLIYLVSPSSDFITGTVVKADDGQVAR